MFYQKKNNKLEPLTGSTLYADSPIGTVIASFLAVAPSGYIKCDDTVYTKADYPDLYERIPDVFKDTTNETFTIDLREVALKGIGLSSLTSNHYSSTGLTLGEFIEDRLLSHRHQLTRTVYQYGYTTTNGFTRGSSGNFSYANNGGQDNQVSYEGDATNEVKSVGVNYFIKAKHVALPIDIMDAVSEVYATKEYVDEITNRIPVTFINNKHKTDGLSGWIENNKLYLVGYTECITAISSSSDTLFYIQTDRRILTESISIPGTPVIGCITAIAGQTIAIRAFTYSSQAVGARNYTNGYIPLQIVGE